MAIRNLYWKLCTAIVSAWICLAIAPSINADTKNWKTYRNCSVSTEIDAFTDAETQQLGCLKISTDMTDVSGIMIIQKEPGKLVLYLRTGIMFHRGDTIPIKLRIDKGKVIKKNAQWNSSDNSAYISDTKLVVSLMDELANGRRVAFQVGKKSGEIILNGSKAAMQDFKQRIKPPSINADISSSQDIENTKIYGNCVVGKNTDAFTDAESHTLLCSEGTTTYTIGQWGRGELLLNLSTGNITHSEDVIPIKLRIDKGKVIKRNALRGSDSSAFIFDTKLVLSVMDELAKGKKLAIQVGEERGEITLNGAADAIRYFKQRIKPLIIEDYKEYGNCGVEKIIDAFTDVEMYTTLRCWEINSTSYKAIGIQQSESGGLRLNLSTGVMDNMDKGDEIPITLRIDEGKVIERNARWDGLELAIIEDTQLALSVMNELENAKRVDIQVGEKSGEITLDGSKAAVQDFKQRINDP